MIEISICTDVQSFNFQKFVSPQKVNLPLRIQNHYHKQVSTSKTNYDMITSGDLVHISHFVKTHIHYYKHFAKHYSKQRRIISNFVQLTNNVEI